MCWFLKKIEAGKILLCLARAFSSNLVARKGSSSITHVLSHNIRLADEIADELVEEAGMELEDVLRGGREPFFLSN